MSEFLGEARVVIRPDTTRFRAELTAQLAAATRGAAATVPVTPVLAGGTAGLTAVNTALNTTAQSRKNLTAEELAGVKSAQGLADQQRRQVQQMGAINKAAIANTAGLLGLRGAVLTASAGFIGATVAFQAFVKSIQAFSEFEATLNTLRVVTGATTEEMTAMSETALRLGADVRLPAVTAADAATALLELAKAGLTTQEAMAGVEGVLQLATAAQISNADAALIAANALNSFGLAGDQAVNVADALANAANASQGSIVDFGIAMRQASAVANQVGLSLEDTTSILSLFAKNGLSGSDAGTSLRVALIRLVAPTKKAADEIKRLGLNIRDAQGNLRADVFAQFGEATENFTPAMRDASAALIFGQDAIRAVSIGAREGADGLRLMQFEIDQAGTAAEVAGARTEGLAGSFSALVSTAETLSIQLGELAAGPLQTFLGTLTGGLKLVSDFADALRDLSKIKIPPIEIPFFFKNIETPGGTLGGLVARAFTEAQKTLLQGGIGGRAAIAGGKALFENLTEGSQEATERLGRLNVELQALQTARVEAARAGQFGVAESLTPQIERLQKQVAETKAEIAGVDSGPFDKLTSSLEKSVAELEKVRDIRIGKGLDTGFIQQQIDRLNNTISVFDLNSRNALGSQESLREAIRGTGVDALGTATNIDTMVSAMKRLQHQSDVLSDQLQKAQAEGATPQAQIGLLQQDIATQKQIIAEAEKGGRQPGDISDIRKARAKIISDQNQIDSLQQGIVSDAKAAASEAKRIAEEAQKARDEQLQGIADTFGGRQEDIENAFERAGIRGNIEAQLRLNRALTASLEKELAAIKERLSKIKVSADVRKRILEAINDAIEDARQTRLRLEEEQKKGLEDLFKTALTRADLLLRIAQARDDVQAELAARRLRLAAITKELVKLKNEGKKGTIAWLELKAQQAEEIAAMNEVSSQQKDEGGAAQKFFFEQLQAQQGFAANLLGNLIPAGMTAGLVGVPSPAAAAAVDTGVRGRAAEEHGRGRAGPTSGQAQTTNDILLRILAELKDLTGESKNPEAKSQRAKQMAVMDYEHGQGGVM